MHTPVIIGLAILALPAAALAQGTDATSATTSRGNGAMPNAMDQNTAGTTGSRFHGNGTTDREDLRKTLEQAGFHNVRTDDGATVLHAQTAQGETVTITISQPATAAGSSGGGDVTTGGGTSGGTPAK